MSYTRLACEHNHEWYTLEGVDECSQVPHRDVLQPVGKGKEKPGDPCYQVKLEPKKYLINDKFNNFTLEIKMVLRRANSEHIIEKQKNQKKLWDYVGLLGRKVAADLPLLLVILLEPKKDLI